MKNLLDPGTVVDSGTGDYLRRGALKINGMFDSVYDNYGDGEELTPATAGWITHSRATDGDTLEAEWGKQYNIITSGGPVTVILPEGASDRYGSGIAFRDIRGTWSTEGVTFATSGGDVLFGAQSQTTIGVRWSEILMTYTTPNTWRWRVGQRLDQFSDTAESSIYKRQYKVAVEDQTDFADILPVEYNTEAFEVYVNGNLQYYGGTDDPDTQYGSYVSGQPGITSLNGGNVRFTYPLSLGDIVTFISYQRSAGQAPATYTELALRIFNSNSSTEDPVAGESIKIDLSQSEVDIPLSDFENSPLTEFNYDATEVYVNGNKLARRGTADYALGECSLAQYEDQATCELNGGTWTDFWDQYGIVRDGDGNPTILRVNTDHLSDEDVLTVVVYTSIIGSILSINDILTDTDALYMRTEDPVTVSNTLEYSDTSSPTNDSSSVDSGSTTERIDGLQKLLDIMYPVGSLYFNAHNPNNPADYMGFGTWERYAKGQFIAGHNPDTNEFGEYDPIFGENQDDLDGNDDPRITAGGSIGSRTITLTPANLPEITTQRSLLIKNPDPEDGFLKYWGESITNLNPIASYDEEQLNAGNQSPDSVDNIPPGITVYAWVRTA